MQGWISQYCPQVGRSIYIYSKHRHYGARHGVLAAVHTAPQSALLQLHIQQTPIIRIKWVGERSEYFKNPDNWIFLGNKLYWQFGSSVGNIYSMYLRLTVAQWLRCCATKSGGRWFDPNWCQWNFSLT